MSAGAHCPGIAVLTLVGCQAYSGWYHLSEKFAESLYWVIWPLIFTLKEH